MRFDIAYTQNKQIHTHTHKTLWHTNSLTRTVHSKVIIIHHPLIIIITWSRRGKSKPQSRILGKTILLICCQHNQFNQTFPLVFLISGIIVIIMIILISMISILVTTITIIIIIIITWYRQRWHQSQICRSGFAPVEGNILYFDHLVKEEFPVSLFGNMMRRDGKYIWTPNCDSCPCRPHHQSFPFVFIIIFTTSLASSLPTSPPSLQLNLTNTWSLEDEILGRVGRGRRLLIEEQRL